MRATDPKAQYSTEKTTIACFFSNRKDDKKTPIVAPDDEYFELQIEGLGEETLRTLRWDLPLEYPKFAERKLPNDEEIFERKDAARAERKAKAAEANGKK
jgi:hypothetical protein